MVKNIIFLSIGLLAGTIITSAWAVYESSSYDASSVVGYGYQTSTTTLVPILVDSSGVVQLH